MKRTLLLMTLGMLIMNLTGGCNNSDSGTTPSTGAGTNEVSTNAVSTNAPAH